MNNTNDFRSPLEIFETIHREMLTLIAHCTVHRSLLKDMLLRHANDTPDALAALERWRENSLASIEEMRFGDLNKQDKALAAEVYREATRTAETFWNVLLSQAAHEERTEPQPAVTPNAGYDPYNHRSGDRAARQSTTG